MGVVSTRDLDTRSAVRRALQRESERLDNGAGRAFRLYLAARLEGRPVGEIAVLKAAYEAAAMSCRSIRTTAHDGERRSMAAA